MKTILVTGATAGFGAAFARRFIKDGHRVIATGRRTERLAGLAAELGENLLTAALDVTDTKSVAGFLDSLPESWRAIDVLVNNAGLALGLSPAWEAKLEDWDTMVATNITGLIHVTRAILPGMVARNSRHDHQSRLRRRRISVSGRPCVWRHQSLRAAILAQPARRSGGQEHPRHGYRTRHGAAARNSAMCASAAMTRRPPRSMPARSPLTPEDIAESASWIVSLPAHMNVNRIEMMPTCQASGPFAVKRD